MTDITQSDLEVAKDKRREALIERISMIADLCCENPLEGECGDVAYDLLRQAAAQIGSDRQALAAQSAEIERLKGECDAAGRVIYELQTVKMAEFVKEIDQLRREKAALEATIGRIRAALAYTPQRDPDELDQAIRVDWEAGMSLRNMAKKHGLPFGVVRGSVDRARASQRGE